QGGASVAEVSSGAHTRLRLGAPDERAWHDRSGGVPRAKGEGRRTSMRTTLRMRIASGETGREPVWATWPMMMHRPIPKSAVIKSAVVALEKAGPRESWYVYITVDETLVPKRRACGAGRVAVAFGWRVRPDGAIRVAMVADGVHAEEEVTLVGDWISSM